MVHHVQIITGPVYDSSTVNKLLNSIGVWCERGKDEFDSLGLFKYQKMPRA